MLYDMNPGSDTKRECTSLRVSFCLSDDTKVECFSIIKECCEVILNK